MNTTTGQLRLDNNFLKQWYEANNFNKFPYWVVSPLISAQNQYDFIIKNIPLGCKIIAIDVEIVRFGVTRAGYGKLVRSLCSLLKNSGFIVIVYTGPWRYNLLDYWPSDVMYWIAGYLYSMYPPQRIFITYEVLKQMLSRLYWIPYVAPNPNSKISIWQTSGDRLILPGCANRPIDVNLMPIAEFEKIFGDQEIIPLPSFIPYQVEITAFALTIRTGPGVSYGKTGKYYLYKNSVVILEELDGWGRTDLGWISLWYTRKLRAVSLSILFCIPSSGSMPSIRQRLIKYQKQSKISSATLVLSSDFP